jgi:hypothetical protein
LVLVRAYPFFVVPVLPPKSIHAGISRVRWNPYEALGLLMGFPVPLVVIVPNFLDP